MRHINRKNQCKNILSDFFLDDYKTYILSGMSYKEYCEKILSTKMGSNNSILTGKHSILTTNHSKITSNNSILYSINENLQSKNRFECKYCERSYNRKDNLTKHLKTCKEKKNDDTVKESMTELARLLNEKDNQLNEKDNQLKEELDKRDKQINEQNKQIGELIKKAGIVSQSTQMIENVQEIINILMKKVFDLRFVNTICFPTKRNHEQIKEMAAQNYIMIIIGSFTSANSKRLTELSKQRNNNSYQVTCANDLNVKWFKNVSTVGISAGASTPDYLIKEVEKKIKLISKDKS